MERASGGLSLAHFRVLSAVAAGDERASRVAARLALGKPTVSVSVDALCSRGLLARSGVADDQRAIQLSLTDAGRQLLAEAQGAMTTSLESLAARTGQRDDVIASLVALGEAIDEAVAERHK
jgi:DNA-binding MarR family transcriptional regulator